LLLPQKIQSSAQVKQGLALTSAQVSFLQKVISGIPRLFEALQEGNVKSELVLGLRRVRNRQARLKLVAELVDPGSNPLKTHGSRDCATRLAEAVIEQDDTA